MAIEEAKSVSLRHTDLRFFADDRTFSTIDKREVRGLLDTKVHERLVTGAIRPRLVADIPRLASFRAAVGYFPETREGFAEAWYQRKPDTALVGEYDSAWRAYHGIVSGSFFEPNNSK